MRRRLPDIILIVCDTLGAKHMSLYGYDRRTTPNLERLLEEKAFTIYENCYSTSCWTPPAHGSIFTGLYPHEHGVHELNYTLPDNLVTLPEVLKMMGYYTIGISCNGLIGVPTNFNKGFDVFIELERWRLFSENRPEFQRFLEYLGKNNERILFLKSVKNFILLKSIKSFIWGVKNKNIIVPFKHALNFIYSTIKLKGGSKVIRDATPYTLKTLKLARYMLSKIHNGRPLFLFLNIMQPHYQYNPPKLFRNIWSHPDSLYKKHSQNYWEHYYKKPFFSEVINYFKDLYDEEILYLDKLISEFIATTCHHDMVVIIVSDHGEHFGEYGHLGHILSLHDPVVKVPLLIKYPFTHKYEVVSNLVQINDIYATIIDLIQCPMPAPLSSNSLLGSSKREKAYMEIVQPEVWLNQVKDGRFRDENFVRIIDSA